MSNPILELRLALKPTEAQREKRHWRDRDKDYLLQRELAETLLCSVSTIRLCEKKKRFPGTIASNQVAIDYYNKIFPHGTR